MSNEHRLVKKYSKATHRPNKNAFNEKILTFAYLSKKILYLVRVFVQQFLSI